MGGRDSLMVGVSGVRGIVGRSMTPEVAARFTSAYAASEGKNLVVVGRDTRPSGPSLTMAVISALTFRGVSVIDLGIATTPTVEIMVDELGADGGIIVTASHNGPAWNALKFLNGRGEFLSAREMAGLAELAWAEGVPLEGRSGFGSVVNDETSEAVHIRRILELPRIDRKRIGAAGFKVVVDCVNGAGSVMIPALLRSLGLSVLELFTDTDAPFPHDPEPRPANLAELSKAVRAEKAALGFACDPDADRLVLVDGGGTVCSEEMTLALAAESVLKVERGPLVANMSTSRLLDDVGARYEVEVARSRVGEAHVTALMKEVGAAVGGEGNGGVIYPPLHYGRDAMVGMALVLQLLAERGVTLGESVRALPSYSMVKEKYPFSGSLEELYGNLKKRFRGRYSTIDGIRIDMDSGWVHVRQSNTEPVVRVIAEARTRAEASRLAGEATNVLSSIGGASR